MQLKFINYYSGFTEEWKLSSQDGKTLYLFKKIFFLSKIIYMHTYIYYTCIYIHTYLHMHTYMHTYIHAHPLWARYTMGGCPIHSRMFTIITGLYLLDTSCIHFPFTITKHIAKHCRMCPERQNYPSWDAFSGILFLKMFFRASQTESVCWNVMIFGPSHNLIRITREEVLGIWIFTSALDDIEEIISVKCKGTMRWPPNETQSWGRVKTGIMWCWHVFFVI